MFPVRSFRKREGERRLSFLKVSPLPFSTQEKNNRIELVTKKTDYPDSEDLVESGYGMVPKVENTPIEWTDKALLPTLGLASCFGLLPVSIMKLHDSNQSSVVYSFRWFSPRTWATLFLLSCLIIIEMTALQYMFTGFYYSTKLETIEQTTAGAAFYGYSVISTILFFRLATRWRHLNGIWHQSEAPLLLNKGESANLISLKYSHGNAVSPSKQRRFKCRLWPTSLRGQFTVLTGIILSLALVEHLWHVIVRVLESWNEVTSCHSISPSTEAVHALTNTTTIGPYLLNNGSTFYNKAVSEFHNKIKAKCLESIYTADSHFSLRILESFSRRSHWFVYEQTSYAAWKGLALVGISFVATFTWNFTDLFIMIISMALSTRFKQLNYKLSLVCGKALTPKHWEGLRCQYASLSRLSRTLDDNINGMTFFSIASNLYFICIQLLSGLMTSSERTIDKTAFYFYSFSFLVGRAAGVILLASSINQETLSLPKNLFLCPHHSYCKEVQRFMTELTTDSVSLSGLNLFNITRNFLLGVAGAVVTYEIVLLQLEATNTNSP